jgi:hypothetical protein
VKTAKVTPTAARELAGFYADAGRQSIALLIETLADHLEALEKDAERWRAGCANPILFIDASFAHEKGQTPAESKAACDEAIDRAREAT